MKTIWSEYAAAPPSTSRFPSVEPPPTPDSIARPPIARPTPSQTARPERIRKRASAKIGVRTTYIPVTKPVAETLVRSSPAVRRGNREREPGDREPNREKREQRVDLDRVLDLHEGDAPDGGDQEQCDEG